MSTPEMQAWLAHRVTLALAMRQAVFISKLEPHKVFWIYAIKCPGCLRHATGVAIATNDQPRPKYVLYTITNGEVIPRGITRH